jgi:hypothetical protein
MVIDAHLKRVNNMKKKKYTFALHMKKGGFKIKTVLIIVYFIGNLSFNNLCTFCHLSSDPFM